MNNYKEMTRSIGGFFQLQYPSGEEYYPSLIKLNTVRNALEYILRINNYVKIYIPYYTCKVMLEPMQKLGIAYEFYSINDQLEPIIDFEIGINECFLYTNYFGLKQNAVEKLSRRIKNLIIDNAQAFFSEPIPGIDTVYSCRKFFGVTDGAYLQLNSSTRLDLETDISFERFSHLIKSIDVGKENAFQNYIDNDNSLANNDIKNMSLLTQKILSGINYESCKRIRNQNFNFLHKHLSELNELNFDITLNESPIVYPLLISNPEIKAKLIERKIFVPTYWPNTFEWTNEQMFEHYLAKHLISLPIDHRYNLNDMNLIINVLNKVLCLTQSI